MTPSASPAAVRPPETDPTEDREREGDAGPDATAPEGVTASLTGVDVADDDPADGRVRRPSRRDAVGNPGPRGGDGDDVGASTPAFGAGTVVLAVLAIAGLAGTLFFGFQWNQERTADNAEASMETTASDFLVALFDFDGRTIDEDFDNILGYATGDFADQAEAQFADDDTRAALREVQASSRVEVRDLFVQSFDGDRGRVFAVVDQTIANNQFPQPRSDQVRLEVGLRKVDGDWKIATLDVLEAPAAQAAVAGGTVPTG
ncbi:MAG: hypothetical protein JNK12_04075 [Acidimicrobiales bacterium]|nr:hypothetical protein [Acidimicrobiales bacterium]